MRACCHFLLLLGLPCFLIGLPQDLRIEKGNATLHSQERSLEVKVSDQAVLHWDSFSIQPGEITRFIQPNAHSTVLNRVTGTEISHLLGSLQANGQVYLINPNGVVIGAEGRIDTAGFIASALDVKAEEFLKGDELFFAGEGTASITNLGTIETSSGPVILLAHKIDNKGSISAREGFVSLLAGHEILLDPTGDHLLYISPSQKAGGIENNGSIEALKVYLEADTPVSLAIGQGGPVSLVREKGQIFFRAIEGDIDIAQTAHLSAPKGEVFLRSEKGKCELSGQITAAGGEVRMLGEKVHLLEDAKIDVSHELGGGTVLLGGDYQGKNREIPNANSVFMSQNAMIFANGLHSGDGGKVILWGDKNTHFYGQISAQGGSQKGNGGFVEVSGDLLDFQGRVDTSACKGKTGTLLLDPTNIAIGVSPTTGTWSVCTPPINYLIDTATTPNRILNTNLQTQLASCNVTINTASAGADTGTITITSNITWATANTLTLVADSTILIAAAITNTSATTGFTAINFTANGIGGGASSPGIFLSSGSLTTVGGDILLSGTSSAASTGDAHGIASNIQISTTNGNVSLVGVVPNGATGTSVGIYLSSTNCITSSTGAITLSGISYATGPVSHGVDLGNGWTTGTSGTVTLLNCQGGSGAGSHGVSKGTLFSTSGDFIATTSILSGTGDGCIGFYTQGPIRSTGSGKSISITATSQGSGTGCDGIRIDGPFGSLTTTTGAGSITLNGTSSPSSSGSSYGVYVNGTVSSSGSLSIAGSGGVNIVDSASITTGSPLNGLSLSVNATNGDISIGNSCTVSVGAGLGSALSIQAPSNSIVIGTGPTITTDGSLLLLAGQNITASGTGIIQTSSSAQNVNLVVDNLNPNPPSFGTGAFTIPNLTLCTDSCGGGGGKVYLYASQPGINSLPTTINTASYTPGTLTSTSYAPGTNEFIGYWYVTQPPPDPPLFEVVFKSAPPPPVPPPSPATVQKIQVATTESLNNNAVSTQVLQANNSTPQQDLSAPDPQASCAPPSVSIQAL